MSTLLSPNTQAILLLTAPLMIGRDQGNADLLTMGQYKRLALGLRELERQPADLLEADAASLFAALAEIKDPLIDPERLKPLLARGFQLSQAVERWQARAIWVISRADSDYPRHLKTRLKEDAPVILYGCGDRRLLDRGGLAVVGSRHVDETLIGYTEAIGRLAAKAGHTLVSGGARGIDQAAMRGALDADGQAIGILADSLERAVLQRDHRNLILDERLVLVSPYDPAAGFNVGNAMQRNKVIYTLADAALVVSSDYQKGGTWAGATEQLRKYRAVPVYIRIQGETNQGLKALQMAGALPWPEPETAEDLRALLTNPLPIASSCQASAPQLAAEEGHAATQSQLNADQARVNSPLAAERAISPAEELFATVRVIVSRSATPKTDDQIADELKVSKSQAKEWIHRLLQEGVLEKMSRPVRYRPIGEYPRQSSLF